MNFESVLRSNIMAAARSLNKSAAVFATFKKSSCNKKYWTLTEEGGFQLNEDVTPAEGIRDIFKNGRKYGFECATAMIIVLYKGVLDTIEESKFNQLFPNILLFSWQYDSDLRLTTEDAPSANAKPSDLMYFKNPEFNPESPQWQGENVIKLGSDLYFGHGMGIKNAEGIIKNLNKRRISGATQSAYLEDRFIYPDFDYLSRFAPENLRPKHVVAKSPNSNAVRARIGRRRYIRHFPSAMHGHIHV